MIFKTLKPFEISLHAYSAKYVVARVFDVETKGAAFLKIQVLKLHVWPSLYPHQFCEYTYLLFFHNHKTLFTYSDFYIHFCQNEVQMFNQALPTHPW